MLLDEDTIAACWAWEQDYIGMQIAGTIHNEIRLYGSADTVGDAQAGSVGKVAQHEPSGGRPVDPAARAERGWRLPDDRRTRPAAHRGDGASHPDPAKPR